MKGVTHTYTYPLNALCNLKISDFVFNSDNLHSTEIDKKIKLSSYDNKKKFILNSKNLMKLIQI